MNKKTIGLAALAFLLFIMFLSNPTEINFVDSLSPNYKSVGRTDNYGLFSMYKAVPVSTKEGRKDNIYLGFLKIFILVKVV